MQEKTNSGERRERLEWMDLRTLTCYVAASERTIRDWISKDGLPISRIRKKIYVSRTKFDEWFEAHAIQAAALNLDKLLDEVLDEF